MMQQPRMSPIPERGLWCNDFDFGVFIRGVFILVPGFFCIDGASIPRYLWALVYHPFDAKIILAALVHDWLYWNHQVSKEEADLIFLDLLIANGVHPTTAYLMYKTVAIFGDNAWTLKDAEKPLLLMLYILIKDSPRFREYCFPVEAINL